MDTIPVIDLFAGPGGLGEGFSALMGHDGRPRFRVVLSIEKEAYAHQTLELRAFCRTFGRDATPDDFYRHLRGEITRDELFSKYQEQAALASRQAWRAELGNAPADEVDQRIAKALDGVGTWVLIGGPPCQAYSIAGRARYSKVWKESPEKRDGDHRHFLYREYLRIIAAHQPPVFIMENVKGLLSSEVSQGRVCEQIFEDLRQPVRALDVMGRASGRLLYRLLSFVREPRRVSQASIPEHRPDDFVIRCEDYGIPQRRHRVIILGVRADIDVAPTLIEREKEIPTVGSAIDDLPRIRSGLSREADSYRSWHSVLLELWNNGLLLDESTEASVRDEIRRHLGDMSPHLGLGAEFMRLEQSPGPALDREWYHDSRLGGVCNHSGRSHIASDLHRYFFAACFARSKNRSPKLSDFPAGLLPKHTNVAEGVAGEKFADRFRVQLAQRPSTTVTSHIAKDGHYFIHPDPTQCRSLTVREAARLQTFPDNYLFVGPRTSQYSQVGNAVPPLLARQLAAKVDKLIQDAQIG